MFKLPATDVAFVYLMALFGPEGPAGGAAAIGSYTPDPHNPTPDDMWTISEWCRLARCSRTHYYEQKKKMQGLTPDELRHGGKVFITRRAHEKWIRRNSVKAERAKQTKQP